MPKVMLIIIGVKSGVRAPSNSLVKAALLSASFWVSSSCSLSWPSLLCFRVCHHLAECTLPALHPLGAEWKAQGEGDTAGLREMASPTAGAHICHNTSSGLGILRATLQPSADSLLSFCWWPRTGRTEQQSVDSLALGRSKAGGS